MKKILLILFAAVFVALSVNAKELDLNNDDIKPTWEDFCPSEYLGLKILTPEEIEEQSLVLAQKRLNVFYCRRDKKWINVTRNLFVLPALDCFCATKISKNQFKNYLYENNKNIEYWNNREQDFQKEINSCLLMSSKERPMCYMKVRELELMKNNNLRMSEQIQNLINQMRLTKSEIQNINTNLKYIQQLNLQNNFNNTNKFY